MNTALKACSFLLCLSLFSSVMAQQKQQTTPPEEEEFKAPKIRVTALEKAINPEEYIVGPGDVFSINIWGQVGKSFQITVTPEGNLVVPTIGTLFVDGMTLQKVQAMIIQTGARKYKHTKITANLIALRNFRVHVVGEVVNPGTYIAQAVDRVSDLIEQAGGMREWASEQRIQVRHIDGKVEHIDLSLFKKAGDLANNPNVRGGDVIYVPPIQLSAATVRLEGNIKRPGIYQIAASENLGDFLLRVDALSKSTKLEEIYLLRRLKSEEKPGNRSKIGKQIIKINLFHQNDLNTPLKDGDIIILPSIRDKVYVRGAVENPGPYPYAPWLSISDYVGMAGSTEKTGNLSGVKVYHLSDHRIEKGANVTLRRGDTIIVPLSSRLKITQYLSIASQLATLLIAASAVGIIR